MASSAISITKWRAGEIPRSSKARRPPEMPPKLSTNTSASRPGAPTVLCDQPTWLRPASVSPVDAQTPPPSSDASEQVTTLLNGARNSMYIRGTNMRLNSISSMTALPRWYQLSEPATTWKAASKTAISGRRN